MTESCDDRLWRRSQEDSDRLSMVGACLGNLQHLLSYPDAEDREARLAAIATDLRIALHGDEVARAEVEAYRDETIRRLLAGWPGAEGGDGRG